MRRRLSATVLTVRDPRTKWPLGPSMVHMQVTYGISVEGLADSFRLMAIMISPFARSLSCSKFVSSRASLEIDLLGIGTTFQIGS